MGNHIIIRVLLILCIGFSAISYGCNGDNGDNGNGNEGTSESFFVTYLYVLDTNGQEKPEFSSGEEIQFELNITNNSDSPQSLTFSSGQLYDFAVRLQGTSNIIWLWSNDKVFTQFGTTLTFDSGETKSFTELWDQMDNDGVPVDPGLYEVQGIIGSDSSLWEHQDNKGSSQEVSGDAPSSSEFRSSWVEFKIL